MFSLRLTCVLALGSTALCRVCQAATESLPPVQMFVPGFEVRELPITLTNQNNAEYAPDGRLFTAGYDGRVHLLRDTDGDGLEDEVTALSEETSRDFPLGIVFREGALFITYRNEIARFRDLDGDGVPETRDIAISNWDDPAIATAPMILKARMDFANGLAIGPDDNVYIAMGNAAFQNPYRRDASGTALYRPTDRRGCVLRISADGSRVEQIATGLRYVVSMQFNRHGDLFLSDQEGATWVPNGNPFDELLHIQAGRHYGFPSRHPQFLPDVHDEPSVFDYAPQHQSICGFRFNESRPGRGRFGPAEWEGDAILTGQSRGKLYRTKLVKTAAGYVAQTHLIAAIQALPVDCTISPSGELIVATHTGKPDWGSGPQGIGRIFKIKYVGGAAPQPVLTYAASPTETQIEFDAPLREVNAADLASRIAVRSGRYIAAGDHYENNPPGYYSVVKAQRSERVRALPARRVTVSPDRRTLTIAMETRVAALPYAFSLPDASRANSAHAAPSANSTDSAAATLRQDPAIELAHDLTGLAAEWRPQTGGHARTDTPPAWSGWLPHPDLQVARSFTARSAPHEQLFRSLAHRGTLRLQTQLDLALMLRPQIQPGSSLGFTYAPETVSVIWTSRTPITLATANGATVEQLSEHSVRLVVENPQSDAWIPVDVTLQTDGATEPELTVHWFTAEDSRPRALPLRRVLLPWAQPAPPISQSREIPEIAGGDWENGRALYFGQAACHACHAMRGAGTKFGPDLTNSMHRDYAALLKDIVQPSAAINPDHLGYVVELDDGTTTAGIVSNDTADELTLLGAGGVQTRISKKRIRGTQPLKASLMPEGLLQSLSASEIRDLMTFLLTEER